MANQWLRLWHELPNDPKFRLISKKSGESIALVQAMYIHILVDASMNVTRGNAMKRSETLAVTFDVTPEQIDKIWDAMQGQLLDGTVILGWEKRQPKKEESDTAKSSAERVRAYRDRKKAEAENQDVTRCNAMKRDVTLDKDKDKEYIKESNTLTSITKEKRSGSRLASDWLLPDDWLAEAKAIRSDLSTEQIRRESESFKDYWVGKAGKDASKLDWQATWRNWIRRSSTQAVKPKKFDPFEYVNRSAINGHATIDITPKPVDSANTEIGYIEHKTTFQPF
jgi:hypothetical protein